MQSKGGMQDYADTESRQAKLFLEECERRVQFHNHAADWWLIRQRGPQPPVNWREQLRWPVHNDNTIRALELQVVRHICRGYRFVVVDGRKNQDVEEGRARLKGDLLYSNADRRRERWYGAVATAAAINTPDFFVYNLDDPSPEPNYATRMEWRMWDGIILGRIPAPIFHELTNHPRVVGEWVLDRCGIVDADFAPERGRLRQVNVRLHPLPQHPNSPQTLLGSVTLSAPQHSEA